MLACFVAGSNSQQWKFRFPQNPFKCFLPHTQDKKVPKNQREAYAFSDRDKWIIAEKEEMESIKEMDVYDRMLDCCPSGVKAIGSR